MGLDMYLERDSYVKRYNFTPANEGVTISVTRCADGEPADIQPDRITKVTEEVGYWRKANQIHGWFVEHCQEGKDECQRTNVSVEQLRDLLETVRTVKAHPERARELLPVTPGFFFGNYDEQTAYDDGYRADLDETERILAPIVDGLPENGLGISPSPDGGMIRPQYYYQSSW